MNRFLRGVELLRLHEHGTFISKNHGDDLPTGRSVDLDRRTLPQTPSTKKKRAEARAAMRALRKAIIRGAAR